MYKISRPQTSRLWQPGPAVPSRHHTHHPLLVFTNQTYHSRVICYVGIPNSFFIWSWTTTVCVAGLTSIDNWINRGNNEGKCARIFAGTAGRALSFCLIYHIQVQTIYDGMWSMCSMVYPLWIPSSSAYICSGLSHKVSTNVSEMYTSPCCLSERSPGVTWRTYHQDFQFCLYNKF